MTTLIEPAGNSVITPHFTQKDRIDYVSERLDSLKEMLDGAEDCKWIYNALLEYTLARCKMEEREPYSEEKQNCNLWLSELGRLDPLRSGRWDAIGKSLSWATSI